MTNKNFFKSILVVCLIAFTSVAAFISCEVGLGEAVDVAAPVIKIATPPTAAVIRDTFAIAGTWSDDGSIKSLEVTLKNTGTKKEYAVSGSFEQEANTKEFKGSWQAIVNPLDSSAPIPDGSYEATIKFSDYGSHTTTITKSFVIDNTPPIIVLTRPSTAADSLSSDTYGQTFTLEGQAADTNNVSLIEVEIYSDKDCTPESYLHTVPLLNVPNSINLDVAKFEKGDTTNDYFKIYKDATTDGGAKDFYCKLIAYDGAERYPVEGERSAADEKGNAISTYYLYKDIATEILQNYKINIVYNMLNGTYDEEDSSRSAVSDNVIAKLKEKVRTTGKFTLNPKNNPTFAVTGRSPLLLDGHDFDGVANNISDGSQVVIEVSPGLDGILLDEDSLKVYAIECDANGKAKDAVSKIYPDTSKSESGTSYRFVTTIGRDKGFEIDKTYIFGVEGYDQSVAKNTIESAGNAYGFRMAPSGKAPTLVVDTPESPAYVREGGVTKDGSVLKFSGTVAVEAGKPELKLYRGNNKTPIHVFNFENQTPQHADREYVYTFEYECTDFTGPSAQSDFKLEASQSGNISEYKPTITVLYVKGNPTLKTTIKGPLVDSSLYPDAANTQNLDNINGNFDFEGTVSQKVGLYDVIDYDNSSWTFTGTDKNGAAKTETGDLAAAFAGKINTLNYKDKTTATLTIVVKDLAGNEKTETHQFFINQESDKPRFTAQNFDLAVTTEAELDLRVAKKKQNTLAEGVLTNMFSTSQVMKYTVEDDDGVKETKVKVGNGALQDADGFTLPDGKSQLTFYVYDTNYDSSKDATYNANYVYSFTVWVLKGQAPTVDIISTPDYVTTLDSNVASDAKKTFTVTGTVSGVGEYTLSYQDPDAGNPGTHRIYYKLTSEDDTTYTEVTKDTTDNLYHLYPAGDSIPEAYKKSITWKDEFTPHNGSTSGTVKYTINGALNSTDKEFNFRVDSGRPTITFAEESVQASGSTIYSTSYRFNGKAVDSGISGLTKVEIQFTNKGGSPEASKWMAADGTGDWYKNIYFANGEFPCFTTQGEKTIHVRATDGAGNYSVISTKDFKYDTEYPTITINNKPNGYLPKGSYSLTGYITEKYGIVNGTKLVVREFLKVGSNYILQDSPHEIAITKGTGENQYNYSWAMSIPFVSSLSGDLKYTFSISDANGNPLNADELLLTRDIVDPVVVISSPSSNTFGINSISGTSATLSGTVTEKDKDKLYYQIQPGTTAADDSKWTEYDISDLANETDTWRVPVQLETTEYPDGKYTLYVKAKDKAGNESTAVSQAFSIDRADPVVKVKVMKREGTTSSHVEATLTGSSTIKVASGTGYDIQIEATDDSGIQSIKLYDITDITTSSPTEVSLKGQANEKITNTPITTEGTKSYNVIVKDKSGNGIDNGKTVEKTISVIYDKYNPTASITTIANDNDWISGTGKVYISGAATDNSGIKSIKMSLNGGTAKPVPVANPWTYELDCSSLTENTDATDSNYKLVLTVEDNCEKETTVTRYFKLDKTTPVIKNLSVKNATTGAFTTSIKNVKASGLAFDGAQTGYRPVIVTIEAKNASGTQADIGGTNKVITVATTSTQNTDFGKFNQAVATNDLADGEYTFTIKATDYAGNTAEQEAVITVDNTPPSVTTPTLSNWNDKHSSAKINVTFVDVNPDSVYYYVNDYSDETITAANNVGENDWTVMTLAATSTENEYTASKSHSFADGHGVVYVKVVDKAGNISYGTTAAYEVDTKAPDICTLEKVDGAILNGSKLINGLNDVTFTVNASDYNDNNIQSTGKPKGNDVTRVASVELTKIGSTIYEGTDIISGEATLTNGTTGTKTGEWTITIPKENFSGMTTSSYPVTVTVADTKGNKKDFQLFTLDVDQGKPEIKSYALSSSYDAGVVSSVQTFYMNNQKAPFTLTGIAKDDREIEEVKLTIKKGSDIVKELTSSDSAWTFTSENTAAQEQASNAWTTTWSGLTGSVTVELSVKDKALNPEEPPTAENKLPPLSFKIIFDTTAPVGLHAFDKGSTPKDIYFRVGDQDRDDGSSTAANGTVTWTPAWDASLDKDVGGKYTAGTFGNKETIKIRGNFTENGSGVKMIYYKLSTSEPSDDDITNLKTSPASYADGYFAPKPASETKRRVFYTGEVDGVNKDGTSGSKNYVEISSTYLTTISGFQEGNNYLVLVAEDNVGNTEVDTVSSGVKYYTINVDTLPPETTALTENLYSNRTEDLTLSFTVEDKINKAGVAPAGIKKVTVNIQGVANTSKDKEATLTNGKYKVTIPKADLPGVNGQANSYSISVTTVDKAGKGNTDTRSVGNLIVDLKAPELEIGNISDADISTAEVDVNGTVTISGTASDETQFGNVALAYKKATDEDTSSNWHTLTVTGTNNWSATFNTTATDVEDNNEYTIRAIATDSAGNTTTKTTAVKVNQNTDRPVVKFTNLANVGTAQAPQYILKYGTNSQLEGNISDDDSTSAGVVDTFIVSSTQITTAPTSGSGGWTRTTNGNDITWTHTSNGTTKYNKVTGDYTYTPAVTADGSKDVYFFVKDNKGKVFYTAHTTQLNQPYQQYKQEAKANNSAMLTYKSDGTSPVIKSIELQPYTDSIQNGSTVAPGTNTVVGGKTKNKIQFIVKAQDGNGIKNMSLEYTPQGGSATTIQTGTNGSFTASTTDTETTWTTDIIDISSIDTGSVNIAITVNDQCELFANSNTVFLVDNDGPVINITSPKETDEITGGLTISGTSTDTGNAGASTIDFIIPTASQRTAGNYASLADALWGGNLHADATVSAFRYDFNGDTTNDNALFDVYTKDDTSNTYGLSPDDNGIYTVPVVFRSKDTLGNITIKEYSITYNPDGDKPKTEITYPSAANYESAEKQYVTLGGEIRVTGSVSIPSLTTTPERVYLQIADSRKAFDSTDKTKAGAGTGNYGYEIKTLTAVGTDIGKTIQGVTGTAATNWWGIEAIRSSNAWSINLNSDSKMNPTGSNTNDIYIRACGVNAEGKMGSWSDPVCIHIDASAPSYTTKLYQFSTTPAVGSQTAEKDYEPGIYLKGQWYLGLHITDEDTVVIDSVKKGGTNGTPLLDSDITKIASNGNKTMDLFIKLDGNATSIQTYTVSARDNATGGYHWIYPSYDINIDNVAPTLTAVVSDEGYPISMTKQRTSNKVITFGSTATDTGSGFSRLAYYFKRGSGNTATVELPLPSASDAANNKWKLGSAYKSSEVSGLDTDSDLYGVTLSGEKNTSGGDTTFTITSGIEGNIFIRKGGLVKMAGTYHRIKDVSGSVVTVDGTIASTVTSAFFPIAFVVDNTSSEGSEWDSSGNNIMKGDDGDGVVESVKKAGSTWTWDTSVYAGELDDGEVTLVCVAFDVAENAAKSETTFMLANKTPRVSKLYLATDLNGNGMYSDDELGTSVITASGAKTVEKYYSALNAGSLQEVFTVYGNTDDENNSTTTSGITMRDKLGMAFEFVSGYEGYGAGQGDLKYKLSIGGTAIETGETGTTGNLTAATNAKYDTTTDTVTSSIVSAGLMSLEVPTAEVSSGTEDALNYLHITLWDNANGKAGTKDGAKTENNYTTSNGGTATYDTYASFGAQWTAFNVPVILDLVDSEAPTVTIENPVALGTEDSPTGHVDLKESLSHLSGSNEFDNDDKVSGKIKFTGTINDEKRISNIKLTVNKNFSGKAISNATLATYNTSTGAFNNTTITPNGATGLTFKITDSSFSTATGHTVTWELEVDSETVAGNAAADVLFTLTANDGTNDGTANHKVDIVPYITSLDRPNAKTNTHRSRRGKYQVVLGENLVITGFNLPGTTANAIELQTSGNEGGANVKTSITASAATGTSGLTFAAPETSGYIKVVTSGVSSVNNFNGDTDNNKAESEYSGDEWYDDYYLSVWKNDEYFWFSNDPISPSMDREKYNGTAADVRYRLYGGWATQGSRFYASYANTTGSGSPGNAPSPAKGIQNGNNSENFGDPATFYDVAINGRNRYNVLIDCWQGNTRMWGRNFSINKNGNYYHNGCQGESNDITGSKTNNLRNVIERMGGCTHPDNADSSDGQDEMFNQFINPRIALSGDYAYITYYDRYAKCLKWAVAGDFTDSFTMRVNNVNTTFSNVPKLKYATEGVWTGGTYSEATTDTITANGNGNLSKYYTNGGMVVAGYDTTVSGGTNSNLNVGLWSDIAIDNAGTATTYTDDKPVIAYYDTTHKSLWVATSAKADVQYPVNTNTPVLTGAATSTTQGNAWTRVQVTNNAELKDLRLGEYVSLALDGGNNIHIACKDAKNNALYYIYGARSSYGSYTFTGVCVDNNGSPGNWTDIKLTNPSESGTAAGPVISYYDPTNDNTEDALKVAYLESDGEWDTMTVPCNSAATANRITLALDVTDGASIATQATTTNNSKLAIGYVSSRFDCVYLRKE